MKVNVMEETKSVGILHMIKGPEDGGWIPTSSKSWFRPKLFSQGPVLKVWSPRATGFKGGTLRNSPHQCVHLGRDVFWRV